MLFLWKYGTVKSVTCNSALSFLVRRKTTAVSSSFEESIFYGGKYRLVRSNLTNTENFRQVYLESMELIGEPKEGDKPLHQFISCVSINRAAVKNALGMEMMQELNKCIDILNSTSPRVVIFRSAVPKVFCAGADLRERIEMSNSKVQSFVSYLRETFDRVARLPMPTIAAVHGAALGGGLELALACDLRISGSKAKLGLPETGLAIIPGAGGTQRLPKIVGTARAKELVFTGKLLGGSEALEIGLVTANVTASQDDLSKDPNAEAIAVMGRTIQYSFNLANRGPVAMKSAKRAIDLAIPSSDILSTEGLCYDQTIPTDDRMEGLKAFIEGRSPIYQGK